jgi:hypothetical protein
MRVTLNVNVVVTYGVQVEVDVDDPNDEEALVDAARAQIAERGLDDIIETSTEEVADRANGKGFAVYSDIVHEVWDEDYEREMT